MTEEWKIRKYIHRDGTDTGRMENVLTLRNGDEVIVRRSGRGYHVWWPREWMASHSGRRGMIGTVRFDWYEHLKLRETKNLVETRLEYMRGV